MSRILLRRSQQDVGNWQGRTEPLGYAFVTSFPQLLLVDIRSDVLMSRTGSWGDGRQHWITLSREAKWTSVGRGGLGNCGASGGSLEAEMEWMESFFHQIEELGTGDGDVPLLLGFRKKTG